MTNILRYIDLERLRKKKLIQDISYKNGYASARRRVKDGSLLFHLSVKCYSNLGFPRLVDAYVFRNRHRLYIFTPGLMLEDSRRIHCYLDLRDQRLRTELARMSLTDTLPPSIKMAINDKRNCSLGTREFARYVYRD